MLIKDNKFNLDHFKEIYKTLNWQKAPRKLGPDHSEFFYVGTFENDEKRINIQIRPSMRMKVMESFKGFDKNGKKIKDGQFNFGTTVEILIDEDFAKKIKEIASVKTEDGIQKVVW